LLATPTHGTTAGVSHLVFAQTESGPPPLGELGTRARPHFEVALEVLGNPAVSGGGPGCDPVTRVRASAHGASAVFSVAVRPVQPADVARAREAERRGRAAGMGDLAARCRSLWIVEADPDAPAWLTLELCALLAFGALGPVLPPDGSTLLGVRSARERARELRAAG
jgi:hypothetical protein